MKKIKITKHNLRNVILPAIILIQLALIAVLAFYVHITRQDVNQQSTVKISLLITKAVDSLLLPASADAKTGAIYIREAKLTLPPAPDRSYALEYDYTPAFPGGAQEIDLAVKNNVSGQEDKVLGAPDFSQVFDNVPKLQACARGYQLFFARQNNLGANVQLAFSKKLNDGRTIYSYLDNGCTDNSQRIIPYLKQIQSY